MSRSLFEALTETPIGDILYYGDMSKPGSLDYQGEEPTGAPRKLVQKPAYQHALRRFFDKCPVEIDVGFANSTKLTGRFGPDGLMTADEAEEQLGFQIFINPDAVNIVYTTNRGDDAVPLTPWIVAHRLSHALAIADGKNFDDEWDKWVSTTEEIARSLIVPLGERKIYPPGKAAAALLGTTKMARDNKVSTVGEWFHDSFAQYILTGDIKILGAKDARTGVPYTVSQGWGFPSGVYQVRVDADHNRINGMTSRFIAAMKKQFNQLLKDRVGELLVIG